MKIVHHAVSALLISLLVSGCGTKSMKQNDDAQRAAAKAEFDCASRVLPLVDDDRSDAMTIALSVAVQCNAEYQAAIQVASATLDNDTQRRMFARQMNSQEQKIQSFLPWVLQYRRLARTPK